MRPPALRETPKASAGHIVEIVAALARRSRFRCFRVGRNLAR